MVSKPKWISGGTVEVRDRDLVADDGGSIIHPARAKRRRDSQERPIGGHGADVDLRAEQVIDDDRIDAFIAEVGL